MVRYWCYGAKVRPFLCRSRESLVILMLTKLQKAITEGNVCVIGPPGTGKSRLLVCLLNWLTQEKKISTFRILVFSFNRRWAKIIREQAARGADKSCLEMPINTFHSFCLDFLRDLAISGYVQGREGSARCLDEDLTLLNATQQWNFLWEVMSKLDQKNYPLSTSYMQGSSFTANSYMQEVYDFILRAQENLLDPGTVSAKFNPYYSKALSEIAGIYARYLKKLKTHGVHNYGLLLQDTVQTLKADQKLREQYQRKYDYILVDESQELNHAQLQIVDLLARENCIFWGNDDESIFSFRGSMSENFKKIWARVEQKNMIRLKHNYRNSKPINRLASNFISKNENRLEKKSSSSFDRGKVMVKDFNHMLEEAGFICAKIRELADKGVVFGDIAVIVKGLGYETHIVENALQQNGIPFQRSGTRTVLDHPMVRYMLQFLKLFRRPFDQTEDLDSILESIFLSPVINLDPLYCKKIMRQYRSGTGFAPILDFLEKKARSAGNTQAFKIQQFIAALKKFDRLKDGDVFDFLLELAKDDDVGLKGIEDRQWDGPSDFLSSVKNFSEANKHTSIDDYLCFLEKVEDSHFLEEIERGGDPMDSAKVQLLSFHQCKGLEFEAVFIPFINLEYIPATFSFPQSYDIQLFAYFSQKNRCSREALKRRHLENERRLLYVGLTRAKNHLFVTSNRTRPQSPFFLDLAKEADKLPAKRTRQKRTTLDQANGWQVRKRAMVLSARKAAGLYYSKYKQKKFLTFLNRYYPPDTWWTNRKATRNSWLPSDVFEPVFSFSALETYRKCPLHYKFRYYFCTETESSLIRTLGILYHRVLQDFYQNGSYTWEALRTIVEKLFDQEDFGFKALKSEYKNKALADFKNYYQNHLPSCPESSLNEHTFCFKLGGNTLKGRIDQINLISDDAVEVIDYKSGSKKYSIKDLKEEIQLKLYRMALERCSSLKHLKQKEVRLKYISLGSSHPPAVLPPSYYNQQQLEAWLDQMIQGIKQEDFSPRKAYSSCQNCDFKVLCERSYG